jgi:glycosyltransferase involved in cell wall biosynthesis
MKKALIISYYFPPHNGVPGWRAHSWFQHFHKSNIHPTIITRHWSGNENSWDDSIKESNKEMITDKTDHGTVFYLPYQHSFLKKVSDLPLFKISILSKIYYFALLLTGRLAIEIDAYYSFKKFLKNYLKDHAFDMVIVTAPPHNMVRLGYYLKRKYKIPLVVDFRDLWDNDELKDDYKPIFTHRLRNAITKIYMKRWLRNVDAVSCVSESIAQKINLITRKKAVEITNGFEAELFINKKEKKESPFFTISYIGTIYPQLDLSVMINGLNKFISVVGTQKVKLNFIGTEAIGTVAEQIKKNIPKECLVIGPRISKEEAIDYTLNSDVLLHAAFKSYKGIYTGKLFYYLGSKRNILIAPGDNDVIDALIKKTNAGKIANAADEFYTILIQWFTEWRDTGTVSYKGNHEVVNKYTRENQAMIFAEHILNALK